jgi:hypothetical protein
MVEAMAMPPERRRSKRNYFLDAGADKKTWKEDLRNGKYLPQDVGENILHR